MWYEWLGGGNAGCDIGLECEEVTLHGVGGGGSVVTGPSHSPENAFKLPDGKFAHLGELPLPAPAGARVLRGVSE